MQKHHVHGGVGTALTKMTAIFLKNTSSSALFVASPLGLTLLDVGETMLNKSLSF